MTLRGDDRGQSVVIGSLLIFTILVLSFSAYQGFVVPNENAQVESDHFQDVEDQFLDFRGSVINSIGGDEIRSTTFKLGTRYPSRSIALNPPPAAGRLETTETGDVTIRGAGPPENVCDSDGNPTTRTLVYTPGYNEYQPPRAVSYEHRIVTREFSEGNLSDQRLVEDDESRVNLVLLTGAVSQNGVSSYTVEVSGSHKHTTRLTDPTIILPSRYSTDAWNANILDDQNDVTASTQGDRVRLSFDGEWEVSCAVIGLNSDPAFTPPKHASGGSGGGGGDGGGDDYVGTGGTESWDSGNTTRRISTEGGLWTDIGDVDSVVLGNPRLTPLNSDGSNGDPNVRYIRFAVTIGDPPDGNKRYTIEVPNKKDGIRFKWNTNTGRFEYENERTVRIYEEDETDGNDVTKVFEVDLAEAAIEDWYQNDADMNLLDPSVYDNPNADEETALENIRDYLSNSGQEAFITDVRGRVNLTIEDRNIGGGPPTFSSDPTVTDSSSNSGPNRAEYSVQYSIDEPSGNFSQVRVEFNCTSQGCSGNPNGTETSPELSDTISYTSNNNAGESWTISAEVIDGSGTVTDTYTVSDTADGNGQVR